MKPKAEYRIGVGASSILMILVTLALAALGLLTLYAAKNNAALCARNVSLTVQYYHAADQTQRMIAAIDEGFTPQALARMQALQGYVTEAPAQGITFTYTGNAFTIDADAGAGRTLHTEGTLAGDHSITLTRHTLSSAPAETQAPLPVYQP